MQTLNMPEKSCLKKREMNAAQMNKKQKINLDQV